MIGRAITHWTIRLSLLCLAAYFAGILGGGSNQIRRPAMRWIWTVGCMLFLAHVLAAFAFFHQWSHQHAFTTTADRTQELMGFRFGEGIYFSYLFGLLWLGDVMGQWIDRDNCVRRSRWINVCLLTYMAFIAINGAIVFEQGITRWVGVPVVLAIMLLALTRWLTGRCLSIPVRSPIKTMSDPPGKGS